MSPAKKGGLWRMVGKDVFFDAAKSVVFASVPHTTKASDPSTSEISLDRIATSCVYSSHHPSKNPVDPNRLSEFETLPFGAFGWIRDSLVNGPLVGDVVGVDPDCPCEIRGQNHDRFAGGVRCSVIKSTHASLPETRDFQRLAETNVSQKRYYVLTARSRDARFDCIDVKVTSREIRSRR